MASTVGVDGREESLLLHNVVELQGLAHVEVAVPDGADNNIS